MAIFYSIRAPLLANQLCRLQGKLVWARANEDGATVYHVLLQVNLADYCKNYVFLPIYLGILSR